jgi:V8-like Glu-specific endopeptidase
MGAGLGGGRMRRAIRRVLSGRTPLGAAASVAAAIVFAIVLAVPADRGEAGAVRGADPSYRITAASTSGQAFNGLAAVGALFSYSAGRLGSHFCTASVVHSHGGDLAVTAAHCVTGKSGQLAFVPGYANGKAPYGVWTVTRVYTDQAWQAWKDPDDDVAFLRLSPSGNGIPIEDVTGAEQVGAGDRGGTLVRVIGYPDGVDQPVWCVNRTKSFSATQLEFDCAGYTDGTSGGPFLTDVSGVSGQGTIIGVIGGYEQGGTTPSVSYASVFGADVTALYQSADADG